MPSPTEGVPRLRDGDGGWRDPVATGLRTADRLLLATDFDGTLSEIREAPDAATIREDAGAALQRLADAPGTDVAVVSGRALADVGDRVGVDGVACAGNHGLEIATTGREFVHPDAEAAADAVERVCDSLRDALADVDGAIVEEKGVTATVHYRQVDDDAAVERVRETTLDAVEGESALHASEGRQIVEFRPDVDWDKGRAVEWLIDELDAGDALPVYVGDDVTDEDAFRAIGDAGTGVVVGDPDETAADYRLDDPAAVADFLSWLAEVRTGE